MTKHQLHFESDWPKWIPAHIRSYISHVEQGQTIRALAREDACHASTVMRQVRQVEQVREDPQMDAALTWLMSEISDIGSKTETARRPEFTPSDPQLVTRITRDLQPALRRIAQPKAVLAIADGMDRAVIVRDRDGGETHRLGVVDRAVVHVLLLNGWIVCDTPARISRYRITAAGRATLNEMIAREENLAGGFAEAPATFGQKPGGKRGQSRTAPVTETPVTALARRRDPEGHPYLEPALVRAAERIQDDFELAQMEPRTTSNWDSFLTAGVTGPGLVPDPTLQGATAARERVSVALRVLGPGLGDVVLECCCRLRGLESAERKLGWSARSGKIVLRIALQRLRAHYDELNDGGGLIG